MDNSLGTAIKWIFVIAVLIISSLIIAFFPLDNTQKIILGVGVFLIIFLSIGSEIEINRYI